MAGAREQAILRLRRPRGPEDGPVRAKARHHPQPPTTPRTPPPPPHLPRAHTRHATRGAPPGEEKEERHTALGRRPLSLMILPQVHLRKPCYDFYFL